MIGDKLASGAPSATFTGPRLKFDEFKLKQDFKQLPAATFMERYMIAQPEYDLMLKSNGEEANTLIREIQERTEAIERLIEEEKREDAGLRRECFIEPFVAWGISGRVIVSRDKSVLPKEISKLALPRHLRKERERLPTTGHVIKSCVYDATGLRNISLDGKRVLFGPMSGTAICFRGYPTWIALDVAEIIGIVHKEDAQVIEEELEPLS